MADGDDIIVIPEDPDPYGRDLETTTESEHDERDLLSPLLGSPSNRGSINVHPGSYGNYGSNNSNDGYHGSNDGYQGRNNNNVVRPRDEFLQSRSISSTRPRNRQMSDVSSESYHVINSTSDIPEFSQADNLNSRVAVSLYVCKQQVITPYRTLLKLVGWQPVFEDADTCWRKMVNIFLTVIVLLLIVLGYILQFASCFRRDSAFMPKYSINVHISPAQFSLNSSKLLPWYNTTNVTSCTNAIVSQFIVPDLFHSAAYAVSFFILRFKESEHLITLIERTFLQTSQSDSCYFLSQRKLIKSMRVCLYISVLWVTMSIASQALHVGAIFDSIQFRFMMPTCASLSQCKMYRIILLTLMLISFIALDVVYVVVVMNYSIQCLLLVFYIEGLQEKVRQRLVTFVETYRAIAEFHEHLSVLNYHTALALSIVLFNFAAMSIEGILSLIANHSTCSPLQLCSSSLSIICWIFMILYPLHKACQLSGSCNSLRKLGHEVCRRPFRYQDTAQTELDSFLLYTSSLNMRAKIFLIPVRTSYIAAILTTVLFFALFVYQTNVKFITM